MRPGPFPDPLTRLRHEGMQATAAWDPTVTSGGHLALDITVAGAQIGDFVLSSFSLDVEDLHLDAQVTAENTVTAVLYNNTGSEVNLDSGEAHVRVIQK